MAEHSSRTADALLVCSYQSCGQTFRRRDYLQRHESMHTGNRPFICEWCNKAFGRSDVLSRHKKKCPGIGSSRPPVTQQRSISPYSPSNRPRAHQLHDSHPPSPTLVPIVGDIESRLALIPVTNGRRRKRMRSNGEMEDEDESDVSVGSLDLRARSTMRSSALDPLLGARGTGRNLREDHTRQSGRTNRRMPILDVDFPVGPSNDQAAELPPSMAPAMPASEATYFQNSVVGQISVPQPQTSQTVPPQGLDWFSSGETPFQDDMFLGPNFEAYLPDANFDFEAFLSSTAGDDPTKLFSAEIFSVEAPPSTATLSGASGNIQHPSNAAWSASDRVLQDIGGPPDANSIYHVPVDRFKAYYQMTHWSLPKLVDFAGFAERTKLEILPHFDFIHLPTFRLDMLATCLAFTLCAIGADHARAAVAVATSEPEGSGAWEYGPMVRNEMTIMIMKSFSVTKRMTMSDYNLALNQSLLLLQASEVLSEQSHERMRANMFRTTIVNTARQLECYNPQSSHFRREVRLPVQPWTFSELDLHWRRWIQLEVRRRSTYFIYIFDVLATIETSIPCITAVSDIAPVPLPAPPSVWKAEGAEQWLRAAKGFKPITLDEALRALFQPASATAPDGTAAPPPVIVRSLNRFALHVIILAVLRGVIEIGEGRRRRGDWHDLTDLWLDREDAEEWIGAAFGHRPAGRSAIMDVYTAALQQWRSWWDALPPQQYDTQLRKPPLCEEALPIFWLVQALLGVLASANPIEVRRAFITRINFAEMLNSARSFTRTNEALPATGSRGPGGLMI